ncbi:MAG TPA: M56 family metallopeptidase [Thermoanaerobaculia bacterium]|nr:M56 family metallopeptidase [Thermoanaerobaculia bacterium]
MSFIHTLVARYATSFTLHVTVSTIVLAAAIAASYLPRLSARTRFAILTFGLAKFLVPASLLAPFMDRARPAVAAFAMPLLLPVNVAPATQASVAALDWIVLAAAAICVIHVAIMLIGSGRTVAAAMRSAVPASLRDVALLNAARKRVGVPYAIDVVRSPISEAPAVLRVVRPLIVLPADGPDALDDDELESLICHECAHVARRDNLLALFAGIIRAIFWFNPLVWLAQWRLAAEREKACDEIVADRGRSPETYAQALAKICHVILAKPAAGVSCMASAHLKQRMEHIMRYESSRRTAFSHLAITSAAIVILFTSVAMTAALKAVPASAEEPYAFTAAVTNSGGDVYVVQIKATEGPTRQLAWAPRWVRVKAGETFTVRGGMAVGAEPDLEFRAEGRIDQRGHLLADINVTRGADVLQRTKLDVSPAEEPYVGAPITMDLKGADIRDVLQTFAQFTGLQIVPDAAVQGPVDAKFVNVPWDKALDTVLRQNGYTWRLTENTMTVSRR